MKIRIRSEEVKFSLWLPLSLIKSRLVLGIIARSTAKKLQRGAADKAAGIADADEIAEAAADAAEDVAEIAEAFAEDGEKGAERVKRRQMAKTATKFLDMEKILQPAVMREVYKVLKKHKGLTLVDVHSADGDIVEIKV